MMAKPTSKAIRPPQPKRFKFSIMRTQSGDRRRFFGAVLARLLEQKFPGALRVISNKSYSDHHIPGISARLVTEYDGKTVLCVGATRQAARETTREMVATGLIWLGDFNSRRRSTKQASELWYCFLEPASDAVRLRLQVSERRSPGCSNQALRVRRHSYGWNHEAKRQETTFKVANPVRHIQRGS